MTKLLAALALALVPQAGAVRPIKIRAPEFPRSAAWINSRPFTLAGLRNRRVVLVTFINVSNSNSIRTFRRLNRWWDQYSLKGLMIIGVHSPDYDFDRDSARLRAALHREEIRFPVVMDTGRKLWKEYQNEGWPAHFLIDHKGMIIHDHLGEGGYAEFEGEILAALEDLNSFKPPESYRIPDDPPRHDCGPVTSPIYLGGRRGKTPKPLRNESVENILSSRDGEISSAGKWQLEPEALRYSDRDNGDFNGQMMIIYQGAESLLVAGRGGTRPVRLYVKQDNLWLHSGNANVDVKWDKEDRSYVLLDAPRLYYLTKNKREGMHEMRVYPAETGVALYSFEFSDRCQTDYDHR